MSRDWDGRHVPRGKIEDYLLAFDHPTGASKAAFFARFGFRRDEIPTLRAALLEHPVRNEVTRITPSPHGEKIEVRCSLLTPDGRNPCIATVWMVEADGVPRLITAFPG